MIDTLDEYEVLQRVGEGGMLTVDRGRHSTLARDVAIKVLHPHLSASRVVERPDQALAVALSCPDGTACEKRLREVPAPEVAFPGSGGP